MTIPADQFSSLPESMKAVPRWVLWRAELHNGETRKVPYSASGSKASVADAATWCGFDLASAVLESAGSGYSGLGFMLGAGFMGVDIDNCLSNNLAPNSWAVEIVERIGSYTEISPSGTGLHVIVRGSLPMGPRRTQVGPCRLEMYDSNRYFTVTGRLLDSRYGSIVEAEETIGQIYAQHFGFKAVLGPPKDLSANESSLGPDDVLCRFANLSNSESAIALFNGDDSAYGDDTSAADLAFCNYARQALGEDPGAIDRAYRVSARYRVKWDERHSADGLTYGSMTINQSLTSVGAPNNYTALTTRSGARLQLIRASDVQVTALEWFMPNRIPKSELVVFEGDGGIGKTTVALDIIARATSGRALPDGTKLEKPPNALILAEEDGLSHLTARLIAASADLSRVKFIEYVSLNGADRAFVLPDDIQLLRDAIMASGAQLFYLDALFNHLNPKLKATLYQDMRTALVPLAQTAHELETTIIVTRHWMKARGSASERGLGSADVRNVSRATLTFGRHPQRSDVPPVFVVAMSKGNYGQSADSLLYQIRSSTVTDSSGKLFDVGSIEWIGMDQTTADDLAVTVMKQKRFGPYQKALGVIKSALAEGEVTAEELESERAKNRISPASWNKARGDLHAQGKIKRTGGGQAGPVRWSLADTCDGADSRIA